jgi:hypothetical protein
LERRIEGDLGFLTSEIRQVVPPRSLAAIVLGGGYGRGDGGVRMRPQGPLPYNDYDLLVVLRGGSPLGRRPVRREIDARRPAWEKSVGMPIEISLATTAQLRRASPTLMFFDLLHGYRVLWGELSLTKLMPRLCSDHVPLVEGARLLVNRGSLLAHCKAAFTCNESMGSAERERIVKYLNKAVLACGDALLIANARYTADYDRRIACLRDTTLPPGDAVRGLPAWYARAVAGRRNGYEDLPPRYAGAETLFHHVWELFESVHRWFEGQRLGKTTLDWSAYVNATPGKFPSAGLLQRWIERARSWRQHFPPPYSTLSRTREDALAEWLADLLYLSGRPAVGSVKSLAAIDWVRRFQAYRLAWSGVPAVIEAVA